jgi:hypothetical protein
VFKGEFWTQSKLAANLHGLRYVKGVQARGLSESPDAVHLGQHSGYQALGLAYSAGAARVLLVGYDMRHVDGRAHWHADHDRRLRNPSDAMLRVMARQYDHAVRQLRARGVEVLNCSPCSAITAFPTARLEDVLP